MHQVMGGELTPAQIAGLLVALRIKGETVDEIAAAAEVMRELATRVTIRDDAHLIDTCGTGGDGIHTFNVSTVSAFVAAAAGAKVAKHGGRSVSSACGSADVLEPRAAHLGMGNDVRHRPAVHGEHQSLISLYGGDDSGRVVSKVTHRDFTSHAPT